MSQGTPKPSRNFENASNLRRALGIVYHHVIHDSMRQARVGAQNRVHMAVLVYPGTLKPSVMTSCDGGGDDIFKIPKRQNQISCLLRPKYLGQRYTIPQTFPRFGYVIYVGHLENTFFGFQSRENTYRSEKQF